MTNGDLFNAILAEMFEPSLEVVFSNNITETSSKTKGVTFCDVYLRGTRLATGTAYCGQDDNYDVRKGCQVALKRALLEASKVSDAVTKEIRAEVWEGFNACELDD
ncbi:MAG: hypothetical protein PQJ49_04370 [Sphaerochaetaceae bacterium]|nr:hypothetical protein [Sphaerochaetaceae bacterium]